MPLHSRVAVRKPFLVVALAVLLSAIVVSVFVSVAEANPYDYGGTFHFSLPISIASPQNNTVYTTNNITVIFNVSTPKVTGTAYLLGVHYTADWLPNDVIVYTGNAQGYCPSFIEHNATYVIPDGEHSLTIAAGGGGGYEYSWLWYSFELAGVSVINFTVDTTPPKISILSLKNKTYDTSDVPLDFALNESISQVSYVLDGGENLPVEGNTTLAGLSNGEHNVTVYATDLADNNGTSETRYFNIDVPKPFPTAPVVASAAAAAAISTALLVYVKKRKH